MLLLQVYWKDGKVCQTLPTLEGIRNRVQTSLKTLRQDHKRNLNPTPYKVRFALYYVLRNEFLAFIIT